MLLLVLLTVFLAVLIYRLVFRSSGIHRRGHRLSRPSDSIPLIGNALQLRKPGHVLLDWFLLQQQALDGDTYEISAGPWLPPAVVISKPEDVEFVLKNVSRGRQDWIATRTADLLGYDGIINATGSLARLQREVGLSFFAAGANIDGLITSVLPDVFSSTTRPALVRHAQTQQPLDLQRFLLDLTTEVVSIIVYEWGASSVTAQFSEALDYASDRISRRFQSPLYPLTELFGGDGAKLRSAIKQVKVTGARIVHRARRRRAREAFASLCDNTEPPEFDSLIDLLIDTLGGDVTGSSSSSDPTTLVADSALNFFYTARTNTAQWISWTMHALTHHEQVLTRVVAEISTLPPPSQPLQPADLDARRIPYTAAVLHEALRLYPPVPLQAKQHSGGDSDEAITLPDGTTLPPNTLIIWCVWALNRSTAVWGDDAHLFRPERWLHNHTQDKLLDLAFGGSCARACIGRDMAWAITAWVVVAVLREFSIAKVQDTTSRTTSSDSRNSSDSSGHSDSSDSNDSIVTLRIPGGGPVRVTLREKEDEAQRQD